jgi:hypothetical protein
MLHNTPLNPSEIEMKATIISTLLKRGVRDCRDAIKTTIKSDLPLNETPSFGYKVSDDYDTSFLNKNEVIMALSSNEQVALKREIIRTLSTQQGDSFLCTLCLKTPSQETGFVILLACPKNGLYAAYQSPPVLKNSTYHFEEVIYLNEPQKSLPFLFEEQPQYAH